MRVRAMLACGAPAHRWRLLAHLTRDKSLPRMSKDKHHEEC